MSISKESKRKYDAKRYQILREKIIRRASEYAKKNPEKKSAYFAEYYQKNKDVILSRASRFVQENKPRRRAYLKDYYRLYPERRGIGRKRRRAVENMAEIGDPKLIEFWEHRWKSKKRSTCFWCRDRFSTKSLQTDHIQPLSKLGKHSVENLCVSCGPCNRRKSAKSTTQWNSEISQPVLL